MDRKFEIGLLQETSVLGTALNDRLRALKPELRLDAPLLELRSAIATFDIAQANKALRFVHETPLLTALKAQQERIARLAKPSWLMEERSRLKKLYWGFEPKLNAPLCSELSLSLMELKTIHDNLFSYTRHVDLVASRNMRHDLYSQIRRLDSDVGMRLVPRALDIEGEMLISVGEAPVALENFRLEPDEVQSDLDYDDNELSFQGLLTFDVDMTEGNVQALCAECGSDMLVTRCNYNSGARKQLLFEVLSCRCESRPKFRRWFGT